ncbi:hypothetical protein [Candidatus Palauibacter sp.]|uniref:hypothetical protein n=1 Tax=Candidatus Palauibacter sp. TaxID=3101350 RepID=UPI003B020E50
MSTPDYLDLEIISLKRHPHLDERWLQKRIADNPKLLGLGELVLKDKERSQPRAGRLDLLLQDPESLRRYEVEIQLGSTDESHIIRTIEYWDIERRRYPQYEHCAVIVAENVTGRFLHVIGLFNGFIPLIAVQVHAVRVEDKIGLVFARVLDELPMALIEEEEEAQEPTDRAYWESKGSAQTVKLADRMLDMIRNFAPGYELKYNKHYIGLAKNGRPNNFVNLKPQKSALRFELSLPKTDETSGQLGKQDLEVLGYDHHWRHYKIRLSSKDISTHEDLLTQLMREAHEART